MCEVGVPVNVCNQCLFGELTLGSVPRVPRVFMQTGSVVAQPLSSGLSTEGPHCCLEAVNSRKLPASRLGWGREGDSGSLALGADVSAPGTAAESSNQSVFAHHKRDVCERALWGEGPVGAALRVLCRGLTEPIILLGAGAQGQDCTCGTAGPSSLCVTTGAPTQFLLLLKGGGVPSWRVAGLKGPHPRGPWMTG